MTTVRIIGRALAIVLGACVFPATLLGENRAIKVDHSVLKIRVFKTGLFSAFAHNHEIHAPITEGVVDLSRGPTVTVHMDARKLRVVDPGASPRTVARIQSTMDGPAVLDSGRFPEISFQSTAVESVAAAHWTMRGKLTLHGQTRPVVVDVALRDGHYRGSATLKQRDFGIVPVTIAGGAIKVKDGVIIEFDIVLAQ